MCTGFYKTLGKLVLREPFKLNANRTGQNVTSGALEEVNTKEAVGSICFATMGSVYNEFIYYRHWLTSAFETDKLLFVQEGFTSTSYGGT